MGESVKKIIGCMIVAFAAVTANMGLVGCGGGANKGKVSSVTADPTAVTLKPGESKDVKVKVTRGADYKDVVTVKASDLPKELQYPYDPQKAKALLAEAGFPNGISFTALCSKREDYASTMLIVQEQLRLANINMELKIGDHTAYHADNRSDKNTLAMHSSSYPPIPTQLYFQQLASASEVKSDGNGGGNYSHYGTAMPGIDALLDKALKATDFKDYEKTCREIELQVLRDLPLIGLSTLSFTVARRGNVNLGYEVKGGYARWRFHRATKTA